MVATTVGQHAACAAILTQTNPVLGERAQSWGNTFNQTPNPSSMHMLIACLGVEDGDTSLGKVGLTGTWQLNGLWIRLHAACAALT
jgi:hypothetical protein